jgi:SAM-dependent methyltransferase
MLELLSKETKKIKLLDVGCGAGQFFDAIVQSENYYVDFYGLDPTSGSVAICKRKGYRVFCMDIRQFKSAYRDDLFDVITAYHVLEHIADPKSFLKELSGLINETGAIYISTPYSPMDFELQWYDVLNHPPHHMGRWNLASYKKLAATLGLKLEIFVPEPAGILKTAVISFLFSIYGPSKIKSKLEILRGVIKHPFQFLNHLYNQCKREKIKGKRASNVILAKFSKNETSNYIESA